MKLSSRPRSFHWMTFLALAMIPVGTAAASSIEVLSVDEETIAGLPWLGVYFSELTPDLVREHDLAGIAGVYIKRVIPDSPAEDAALAEGDVITTFDGERIGNGEEFGRAVRIHDPGEEVRIGILRAGEHQTVTARLTTRPAPSASMSPGSGPGFQIRYRPPFGAELAELDERLAAHFSTHPGVGLLVTRVTPQSAADLAGIESGDILLKADGRALSAADDLDDAFGYNHTGQVEIEVLRGDKQLTIDAPYQEISGDQRTLNHSMRALEEVLKGLAVRLDLDGEEAERELQALAKEFEKLQREFRESDEYADIRAALKQLEHSLQEKLERETD